MLWLGVFVRSLAVRVCERKCGESRYWVIMSGMGIHRAVATVRNLRGLHMRPLGLIAKKALSFPCDIHVVRGVNRVDAKSLFDLLTLGAEAGVQLSVEASGTDADGAVLQLVALIESDFEALESPVRAV